jgi:hypothetical protein
MSLGACPKCWDEPCMCGHMYKNWSEKDKAELVRAVINWQPINKAPKDGTKIIGCGPDEERNVMWWSGTCWTREGDDYNLFCEPTLFYPCPPDPLT